MAIALVIDGATTEVTAASSVQPAFGQATAAGNLLIVCYSVQGYAGATPTIDQGWTLANWHNATNDCVGIGFKQNCGSNETAPILTLNGNGNDIFALLAEFSGAANSGGRDQTANNESSVSPQTVTMGAADAVTGSLIIASSLDLLSKAGTATITDSFNNGAVATNLDNNAATSTTNHYTFSYGVTTGNSVADTNTHSDNSMNLQAGNSIHGVMVSFSPAALGEFEAQQGALSDPTAIQAIQQSVKRSAHY